MREYKYFWKVDERHVERVHRKLSKCSSDVWDNVKYTHNEGNDNLCHLWNWAEVKFLAISSLAKVYPTGILPTTWTPICTR